MTRLIERLLLGIKYGTYAGIGLCLLAAVPFLVRVLVSYESVFSMGRAVLTLVALYLFAGIGGGVLVALCWPLTPYWIGRRLIGIISVVPGVMAVRYTFYPPAPWTTDEIMAWGLAALVVGGAYSFIPEDDARRRWGRGRGSDPRSGRAW